MLKITSFIRHCILGKDVRLSFPLAGNLSQKRFRTSRNDINEILSEHDHGYILITVLLLLLVLTVVGMTAIGTSTIENMMSGNIKCRERNLSKSAGGIGISTGIIQRALGPDGDTKCFSGIIMDQNLPFELLNTSFASDEPDTNPDATLQVDGGNVNVDIDKMYSKWINGTAIEYAAGYEGVGKSGSSGIYALYRINSNSTECASNTTVGAIYRYVGR